jgi:hypothetical protein
MMFEGSKIRLLGEDKIHFKTNQAEVYVFIYLVETNKWIIFLKKLLIFKLFLDTIKRFKISVRLLSA